jgi:hypothetical protein
MLLSKSYSHERQKPKGKTGDGRLQICDWAGASIRNQLRLSREQFDDLVICPMSGSEYYELLRKKIRLGLL